MYTLVEYSTGLDSKSFFKYNIKFKMNYAYAVPFAAVVGDPISDIQ